jgi:N-acyl-D-amino-acid deacylase
MSDKGTNSRSIETMAYDILIKNGRVMDPFTRVDAIANVGIKDGKIAAIVPITQRLNGDKTIDATDLVVAPGFINIHGHGSGNGVGGEFHVRDGITTEITGNCGRSGAWDESSGAPNLPAYPLADFFETVEQQGLVVNVACYTGHITLREALGLTDPYKPPTNEQLAKMVRLVCKEMEAGASGITFAPFYGPGCTYEEMVTLAKEVSRLGGCAASHPRSMLPGQDIEAIIEALNTAREADVPFILSHMGGPTIVPRSSGIALELLTEAREKGLKIATDFHGYDAASTFLNFPPFDPPIENLLEAMSIKISDMGVVSTVVIDNKVFMKAGEAFSSPDQWNFVRGKIKSGQIPDPFWIGRIYRPHKIFLWLSSPLCMIENDWAIGIDPVTGKYRGHPRGAGSFARFLGYWVRQRGVCDLMTALSKTSTMAATWLGLDKKGRIQVGCDADLTLFHPDKVIDGATYTEPGQPSHGIPYVIVNGIVVVDNGELTGALAGKAIRRTWKVPGVLPELGHLPRMGIENLRC